jgi:elongation factor G
MTRKLRNIGIMAHVDAGKTTLTERILFITGRIHKAGNVDSGNTATDSHAIEQKRGITISAAATSCDWQDHTIAIIDTPGHVDFTLEVERSLRVLDGAVAVFSAVAGVEPQSETVWRQANRFDVPRLCFINKMDQVGADFDRVVAMISDRLGAVPLSVQMPIGVGADFTGMIDLIGMTVLQWNGSDANPHAMPIPASQIEAAQVARSAMLEKLAEADDLFLMIWADDAAHVSTGAIHAAIRRACLAGKLVPVLCGSAYRHIGVQPLLDAIVAWCPSPADRPPVAGLHPKTGEQQLRHPADDQPFAALVSKMLVTRFGTLAFIRIYAGQLSPGMAVVNATQGGQERVGRLLRMHADQQTDIDLAGAGDVIAVTGLKSVRAGDTLADCAAPIILGGFTIPEPVIEAVIEPVASQDKAKLGQALAMMARSDPSLRISVDRETGQTLVRGMGELHLQVCVETLEQDFDVEARVGEPQVAYRSAFGHPVKVDHLLRKQNGGQGQMARVCLSFEPSGEGEEGLVFESKIAGGAIPKEFVLPVEKALKLAMQDGGSTGHPVIGLKATLLDGAFHEKDSSALAFEIAAREAFNLGLDRSDPILLEPQMRVTITTPEDYLGSLIGDVQSRRGKLIATHVVQDRHEVVAEVPLSKLFNYVSSVRSLSQGRASFSMAYARHGRVDGGG